MGSVDATVPVGGGAGPEDRSSPARCVGLGLVLLLLSPLLMVAGCATFRAHEWDPDLPPRVQLEVPFFPDDSYYCGPAVLASVLNHRGVAASPEQMIDRVYLPARKGALTTEVQAAPRADGLVPYRLGPDLNGLFEEVAAGHPVVVLQNLGLSWLPRWHYAVVVGYDRGRGIVLLHSGEHEYYQTSVRTFANTWRRGDHWAMIVVDPHTMPVTAEPRRWIRAASDLEEAGESGAAGDAYLLGARHWPDNGLTQFAAANHLRQVGQLAEARTAYQRSLAADAEPVHPPAWNNLAFTLKEMGCLRAARYAIDQARRLAPDDPRFVESERTIDDAASANETEQNSDTCPPLDQLKRLADRQSAAREDDDSEPPRH